jgi:hypothetical protein
MHAIGRSMNMASRYISYLNDKTLAYWHDQWPNPFERASSTARLYLSALRIRNFRPNRIMTKSEAFQTKAMQATVMKVLR